MDKKHEQDFADLEVKRLCGVFGGVLFRFVVPVSQFLRRYAREGLIEFFLRDLCRAGCVSRFSVVKSSLFLRQLNAFFRSGGFLRRYGSGCPGRCHLETSLAHSRRISPSNTLHICSESLYRYGNCSTFISGACSAICDRETLAKAIPPYLICSSTSLSEPSFASLSTMMWIRPPDCRQQE